MSSEESTEKKDNEHPDSETIKKMLPLRMTSTVVRGFGRGSTDLGIPTANLDRLAIKVLGGTDHKLTFDDLPCGIYWGFCRIGDNTDTVGDGATVYKTAVSIGYNPTYNNKEKTIEPHLIAPPKDTRRHASSCGETLMGEFYDKPIRLSVVGYLRPELPFEGLEKLVEAIKNDIVNAEQLGDSDSADVMQERTWVASEATES
ncbi:Riboflavin kinase [Seminavis robusta]|uniref:riboflavin kinase n=1 Tax=Seminavis robusta TaxID=568900 RepID=A0A9N8DCF5_9STRA|nr:Riboflavin kinase [Seminavis robusta]|eukprot:Sro88_g046620.1 Riboflavin kinase (202) ;mRNA; f:82190-82795